MPLEINSPHASSAFLSSRKNTPSRSDPPKDGRKTHFDHFNHATVKHMNGYLAPLQRYDRCRARCRYRFGLISYELRRSASGSHRLMVSGENKLTCYRTICLSSFASHPWLGQRLALLPMIAPPTPNRATQ
jgi:hypothetical protein